MGRGCGKMNVRLVVSDRERGTLQERLRQPRFQMGARVDRALSELSEAEVRAVKSELRGKSFFSIPHSNLISPWFSVTVNFLFLIPIFANLGLFGRWLPSWLGHWSLIFLAFGALVVLHLLERRAQIEYLRKVLLRLGIRPRYCLGCGHDLEGAAGPKCHECGEVFLEDEGASDD